MESLGSLLEDGEPSEITEDPTKEVEPTEDAKEEPEKVDKEEPDEPTSPEIDEPEFQKRANTGINGRT